MATSDVVDAYVVVACRITGSVIYTNDVGDLGRLADLADQPPDILPAQIVAVECHAPSPHAERCPEFGVHHGFFSSSR